MTTCLSSSSAFFPPAKARLSFSSKSAFKKTSFASNLTSPSHQSPNPLPSFHPKDLLPKQHKSVKVLPIEEDPAQITSEPTKKAKLAYTLPYTSNFFDKSPIKVQEEPKPHSSRLTIEEVFNTPLESKKGKKGGLLNEIEEEGSSLSFISSYTSLDSLDEVQPAPEEEIQVKEPDMSESLVMKDDIASRLCYLNQDNVFSNTLPMQLLDFPSMFDSELLRMLQWENPDLGRNIEQPLVCVPLKDESINVNEYVKTVGPGEINIPELLRKHLEMASVFENNLKKDNSKKDNKIGMSDEEGYDSDSYTTTRSTSIEPESVTTGEKSQKGASPVYSTMGCYDMMYEEEKTTKINAQVKKAQEKKKNNAARKQEVGVVGEKKPAKERKGRSLNLQLDFNPKHMKVERRLNKLQLLRYQQDVGEEGEEMTVPSEILSRNSSNDSQPEKAESQQINSEMVVEQEAAQVELYNIEAFHAALPPFRQDGVERRKALKAPVWNPNDMEEQEIEEYMQKLSYIIEGQVTDQEAALKLLRNNGMDISLAINAVKENLSVYKEMFRLKVKRLRRR